MLKKQTIKKRETKQQDGEWRVDHRGGHLVLMYALVGAVGMLPWLGYAQGVPPVSAGSLLQEVERQRPEPALPGRAPGLNVPPLLPPSGGPTVQFTVKQFQFTGNTKVGSEVLAQALSSYLNKPITFKDLQETTNVVAEVYAKEGWLARAFLPRQDITAGVVKIQVIEAVYGGSIIEGQFDRISANYVQGVMDGQIQKGQVLSLADVEQALLLVDDLPGVTAVGSLTAGKQTQETDVLVTVTDTPLLTGTLQVDNQGNKSTGTNEVSVNAFLNSPAGLGDLLNVYGLYTDGLSFVSAGYSLPVNYTGLRLGFNFSTLGYRVTDPDLAAAQGTGFANTWGAELSQPLYRSRNTNVYARLAYTNKLFGNRAGGVMVSNYTADVASLALTASNLDSWGGGGYTSLTLTPSMGYMDYSNLPAYERIVEATTQAQGQFAKLRYGLSRTQNLTKTWSMYGYVRGQIASKNLDSSERFYLGGPFGVRAYPNNEGGGAQGSLLSLELRYRVVPEVQLSAFWDIGTVMVNKFNDHVAAANPNTGTLQGAGLSVSWTGPYNVLFNATWAIRMGSNPFANDAGQNQDGSSARNRFWVNASIGF